MSSYDRDIAPGARPTSQTHATDGSASFSVLRSVCDGMHRCDTLTDLFAHLLTEAPRILGAAWGTLATCDADGRLLHVTSFDDAEPIGPDDWTRIIAACADGEEGAVPTVSLTRAPAESGAARSLLAMPLRLAQSPLRHLLVVGGDSDAMPAPNIIDMLRAHAEVSLSRIVAASELRLTLDANARVMRITRLMTSLNGAEPPDQVLASVMDAILCETPDIFAGALHVFAGDRFMHELSRGAVPGALCSGPGLGWWQERLLEIVTSRQVGYRPLLGAAGATTLLITLPVRAGDAEEGGALLGVMSLFASSLEPVDLALRASLDPFSHIIAQLVLNLRRHRALERANHELEQRKAQIIESKGALEAILNGFPDGLFIVDRELRVTLSNEVQASRARATGPEAAGLCWELYGCGSGICPGCHIQDSLKKGKSTRRLMRVRRDGAPDREWEVATHPIARGSAKTPQAALVIVRDVTEQQQIAASLAQVEKLAAVGRLAAGIAHEINNPLAAIKANVQLLQDGVCPDDPRYESLAIVHRSAERAHCVVRNLLSFSEENLDYLGVVDVNATILSALDLVSHQAELSGVTIECHLAEELPQVLASIEQIESVWLNLAMNALDATLESGATRRRMSVSSETSTDGWIRVAFRDGGRGIPPQRMSRVFEPFAPQSSRGAGTGLGLYSCHSVVKRHGGSIRAYPGEGGGSVFEVLLPALPEDAAECDGGLVGSAITTPQA